MTSIKVSELGTAVTPYDGSEYSLGIQDNRSVKIPVPNLASSSGASLVGVTPTGTISATTVAGALTELDTEKATVESVALKANSADLATTTGASLVGFTPTGTISATTVQTAIVGLGGGTLAAQAAAEAARDAALIQAGVYTTEALGRAAVLDGQAFKVQGSGDVAAYEYRRTNSTTSTLIATYPSNSRIDKISSSYQLSSGNIKSSTTVTGQVFSGATLTTSGLSIPSGSTGRLSYVEYRVSATNIAIKYVNIKINFTLYFDIVGDVINGLIPSPRINILTSTGSRLSAQSFSSISLVSGSTTKAVAYYEYIVIGDEVTIIPIVQTTNTTAVSVNTSFSLSSIRWGVTPATEIGATGLTGNDLVLSDILSSYAKNSTGIPISYSKCLTNVSELTPVNATPLNGASTRIHPNGMQLGWTVPSGSTGQNSTVIVRYTFPTTTPIPLVGRKFTFTIGCDTSATYTRDVSIAGQVSLKVGGSRLVGGTTNSNVQTGARRVISFTMNALIGDESAIGPYIKAVSSTSTTSEEWLLVTDITVEIAYTTNDVSTISDENLQLVKSGIKQLIPTSSNLGIYGSGYYDNTITVKSDGTGNFTTLRAAALSITNSSALNCYEIITYNSHEIITDPTLSDWFLPAYVDITYSGIGYGWYETHHPMDTAVATITAKSGIYQNYTSKITGMKFTMKNGRYAIHSDSSNTVTDSKIRLVDCWIEHYGNQDAIDYQTSIGGNPSGIVVGMPWGYGASSGIDVQFLRTLFISTANAGYIHTNNNFIKPSTLQYKECSLISKSETKNSMVIVPLGSGQKDIVSINNCKMVGDISFIPSPWQPTTLSYQPSDRSEINITMSGCSPSAFVFVDNALALSIKSATTTTLSSIVISGTANTILFGSPVILNGGGGLPAQTYGSIDVSGTGVGALSNVFITSMGARLGNCSVTNKTLSITFDGGQVATIVFNVDYTSVSNATILTLINTAIQTAFSNSLVLAELISVFATVRPYVLDYELFMQNTGTVGIECGYGVGFSVDNAVSMAAMSSSDAASSFAGIALDRILPGEWGRVRKKTWLFGVINEIKRTDSSSFIRNDTFGIGSIAGKFIKNAAIPLLVAVNTRNVTGI